MSNGKKTAKVEATKTEAVAQPTEQQLMQELQTALSKGDFKAVATVSRKIDSLTKDREKAEQATKQTALQAVADKVKAAIMGVVSPLYDAGELDVADGVWFTYDFGDQTPTVRLTRTAPKATRAGGGGGGKKYDVKTEDLISSKYGDVEYKDGLTFKQAWEQSTDKNWRYGIRQKLLKLEGII